MLSAGRAEAVEDRDEAVQYSALRHTTQPVQSPVASAADPEDLHTSGNMR